MAHCQAQKPTWPKSRPKPQPTVDDSYKCIVADTGGHRIEIKKSIVPKIPYFKEFFDPAPGSYASVKMNSRGEYFLPQQIDVDYLMPILAFVETGRFSDLMTKLPKECDILEMAALFDRLGIEKPEVGEVNTMSTDSVENASKFCIGILMEWIEKNQTNYIIHNRLWQEIIDDQDKPEVFRHHAGAIFRHRKKISNRKRNAKMNAKRRDKIKLEKMLQKMAMEEDSGSSDDMDDDLEDQDDDDEYEQPQEKFDRSRKGKKKDHYLNRQHRDRPDREPNWREDNDD